MEYYTKYLAVILWRCGCGRCNRYGNFWAEKQESEAVNAESLTPGSWRNKQNPGLGNLMYSQPTWFIMRYGLKHKNRSRQCLVKSTAVNDIYIYIYIIYKHLITVYQPMNLTLPIFSSYEMLNGVCTNHSLPGFPDDYWNKYFKLRKYFLHHRQTTLDDFHTVFGTVVLNTTSI